MGRSIHVNKLIRVDHRQGQVGQRWIAVEEFLAGLEFVAVGIATVTEAEEKANLRAAISSSLAGDPPGQGFCGVVGDLAIPERERFLAHRQWS